MFLSATSSRPEPKQKNMVLVPSPAYIRQRLHDNDVSSLSSHKGIYVLWSTISVAVENNVPAWNICTIRLLWKQVSAVSENRILCCSSRVWTLLLISIFLQHEKSHLPFACPFSMLLRTTMSVGLAGYNTSTQHDACIVEARVAMTWRRPDWLAPNQDKKMKKLVHQNAMTILGRHRWNLVLYSLMCMLMKLGDRFDGAELAHVRWFWAAAAVSELTTTFWTPMVLVPLDRPYVLYSEDSLP